MSAGGQYGHFFLDLGVIFFGLDAVALCLAFEKAITNEYINCLYVEERAYTLYLLG